MSTDRGGNAKWAPRRHNSRLRPFVAVFAAGVLLAAGHPSVNATTPPPIDEIGAQFAAETGATSVACSQTTEVTICYGLLDGAVLASTYAGGVFTSYLAPTTPSAQDGAATGAVPPASTGGAEDVPAEFTNALRTAEDYLDYTAFSQSGLVEQLEYEQYSTEAAEWAAANVDVDWNEQAAQQAADYLDYSAFSEGGLRDQLEYEGFTLEQIDFAIAEMAAQGRI